MDDISQAKALRLRLYVLLLGVRSSRSTWRRIIRHNGMSKKLVPRATRCRGPRLLVGDAWTASNTTLKGQRRQTYS